jgi:hypothetical protein
MWIRLGILLYYADVVYISVSWSSVHKMVSKYLTFNCTFEKVPRVKADSQFKMGTAKGLLWI